MKPKIDSWMLFANVNKQGVQLYIHTNKIGEKVINYEVGMRKSSNAKYESLQKFQTELEAQKYFDKKEKEFGMPQFLTLKLGLKVGEK